MYALNFLAYTTVEETIFWSIAIAKSSHAGSQIPICTDSTGEFN